MKRLSLALIIIIVLYIGSCAWNKALVHRDKDNQETALVTFQLELNPVVYQDSTWGDPPQIAIWLQNQKDRSIRTVLVTHRTAICDWDGKVECSVALPYWVIFYNKQTGTKGPPTWAEPIIDGRTCATPKASLTFSTEVPHSTQWQYFVEVNVSGDFNSSFPNLSSEGISDRYGNGQPSIVYHGYINTIDNTTSEPYLLGRTDQYEPVEQIITDLEGITTAKNLLDKIDVKITPVPVGQGDI